MKSFAYQSPATLGEAVSMLAEENGQARVLAGGTDLLVQMRLDLHDVDLVVDVKKISELNEISYTESAGLTIGAAVPCVRIYEKCGRARQLSRSG